MKRVLRGFLPVLILLLFSSGFLLRGDSGKANPFPDHILLTWTGDPATTMTVSWRSEVSSKSGQVRYGVRGGKDQQRRVKASSTLFATDLGSYRIHTAYLKGLSPATTYTYTVGDEGLNRSGERSFTTADPKTENFKFLVFGDSQSSLKAERPYSLWAQNLHNAFRLNGDAKFIVMTGDLVDEGQSGAHWEAWFAACQGVMDQIPLFSSPGNHESHGSSGTRRPAYWNAQLRFPRNGPDRLKNQVYSFRYGKVLFLALDSQQKEQRPYGDILGPQKEWLKERLSTSRDLWKIAYFHKPFSPLVKGRTYDDVKEAFLPLFDRYHVDLVFNGHDHGLARTAPMREGKVVQRPSQGTVYYVVGRSGDKFYSDLLPPPEYLFFDPVKEQPNYLVVEVRGKSLTVSAHRSDGTLLDRFSFDKAEE